MNKYLKVISETENTQKEENEFANEQAKITLATSLLQVRKSISENERKLNQAIFNKTFSPENIYQHTNTVDLLKRKLVYLEKLQKDLFSEEDTVINPSV